MTAILTPTLNRPTETSKSSVALQIVVLDADQTNAWDAALAISAQAQVFFQSNWLNAVAENAGPPILRISAIENDSLLSGLCGLESHGKSSIRFEQSPLMPYAGPWMRPTAVQSPHRQEGWNTSLLAELETFLRNRYDSIHLDLHPDCDDVRPFTQAGWSAEPRYTYISELTAEIQSAAAPAVRRRAARAARAGVEFDANVPTDEFLRIWAETCVRRGIRQYIDSSALTTLLKKLHAQNLCEILGARLPDGRLVAANVILYDERAAYFWLSGHDATEPHYGASNQLCHLQTLRRASEMVDHFDWLGANTPGVTEYKRSFGPRLVSYYRIRFDRPTATAHGKTRSNWKQWLRACPLFSKG